MWIKTTAVATLERVRPAVATAALVMVAWVLQDMIMVFWDHQQFAQSIICTDAAIRSRGGRYADEHCVEHMHLGNVYLIRAWLLAAYEVHSLKFLGAAVFLLVL
jgi:hypothetical protein